MGLVIKTKPDCIGIEKCGSCSKACPAFTNSYVEKRHNLRREYPSGKGVRVLFSDGQDAGPDQTGADCTPEARHG
jgi:hypothetical protein